MNLEVCDGWLIDEILDQYVLIYTSAYPVGMKVIRLETAILHQYYVNGTIMSALHLKLAIYSSTRKPISRDKPILFIWGTINLSEIFHMTNLLGVVLLANSLRDVVLTIPVSLCSKSF